MLKNRQKQTQLQQKPKRKDYKQQKRLKLNDWLKKLKEQSKKKRRNKRRQLKLNVLQRKNWPKKSVLRQRKPN